MDEFKTDIRTQLITIFEDENNRSSPNCPHDRCPYLDSSIDCGQCRNVEAVVNSINLLKSTITHKEEQAYNKGYADAKADILEKLQAEIAEAEMLATFGDDFFEGRAEGVNVAMNCILSEEGNQ